MLHDIVTFMDQIIEFASNHVLLSGGFVFVLLAFIATEVNRLGSKFKLIGNAQAVQLINREDAAIIDLSASNDFANAHINDAINLAPSEITAENKQLVKLKNRPVILYCKTGQASFQQAGKLVKLGFTTVYVLRGGLLKWREDNLPVIS